MQDGLPVDIQFGKWQIDVKGHILYLFALHQVKPHNNMVL
ncbi:hypothetical protein BACCOP_00199 [Phocaeicola coprocola DSM 17136]|uniref:Uncharacterized protein n=1 Tax=Phocaeicola coprocola DSM 17136 TaxID=470145 RepID=B3JEB0_9BACT|nr:hypothetical protein BACCOP_00199 [Phocaeicola coprocola DSM 17136]